MGHKSALLLISLHPKIFPRMFPRKDRPLFCDCDMCIYFRDVDRAVAEHFLNVADVHIGFQQAGGEGVTEHVRRDMDVDRSQSAVVVDRAADGLIG